MEYFGVFQGLLGPFVLISFRSYGGILMCVGHALLASVIMLTNGQTLPYMVALRHFR